MRIAVVHDWLVTIAGAEKVLAEILRIFPETDLFSLIDFLSDEQRAYIAGKTARTSFLQNLPFCRRKYRAYLPLMPLAIEQLDMSGYDLIISSSHAVAKGVITGPDQLHISYVHTPMRYAWDLQHQYLKQANLEHGLSGMLARWLLHRMRIWDIRSSYGVDKFIANSDYIARRIKKAYRRDATVIHPPVDVSAFETKSDKDSFYVTVGRLVPYKRVDLIISAFARSPDRKLLVIGDGPDYKRLNQIRPSNVQMLGSQPSTVVRETIAGARCAVFAAEEDFGIAVVEAQACGTPVIAYGKGGATETVIAGEPEEGATGVLFQEQTVESLCGALDRFESKRLSFSSHACRKNAERFDKEIFVRKFKSFVEQSWTDFSRHGNDS